MSSCQFLRVLHNHLWQRLHQECAQLCVYVCVLESKEEREVKAYMIVPNVRACMIVFSISARACVIVPRVNAKPA